MRSGSASDLVVCMFMCIIFNLKCIFVFVVLVVILHQAGLKKSRKKKVNVVGEISRLRVLISVKGVA